MWMAVGGGPVPGVSARSVSIWRTAVVLEAGHRAVGGMRWASHTQTESSSAAASPQLPPNSKRWRKRWTISVQRQFLEEVEAKYGITEMEHWQRVTVADIVREGGSGMLRHHKSFFDALASVLADREQHWGKWCPSRARPLLHPGYWEKPERRRAFLDGLKERYHITGPEGWQEITADRIRENGGRRLLDRYKRDPEGGQVLQLLRDAYPEQEWCSTKSRTRLPKGYWDDPENIRASVTAAASVLNVESPEDWYRVSWQQFTEATGGTTLGRRLRFVELLQIAYPNQEWDSKRLAGAKGGKRAGQGRLLQCVLKVFA